MNDQEFFHEYDYNEAAQPRQHPLQSSNAEPRPCTPMGAPKSRGKGCLAAVLVVLVLLGAGFGIMRVLETTDFDLHRDGSGLSLSISSKSDPGSAAPSVPAQEQPALPEARPDDVLQNPIASQPVQQTQPQLELQPGQMGAEHRISEAEGAMSLQAIYQKLIPSVVSIATSTGGGSATGTGIIMSADGYVITNHHVIAGAFAVSVLTSDDQVFSAALVGSDEASDLAVLKVEPDTALTAAEFGDSDALRVGDAVVAIGDPLGTQLRGTMTDGIISAINRDLTVNDRKMTLIQTNAALNNGNSGGPLINCYGQVVGINTMKMSNYYSGAAVEGLGFAIPISVAKPIVDELIEKGYVAGRPALGISGEQLPTAVRAYYRLPDGVYLTQVNPSSDAYQKGLREGDIITAINDTQVSTVDDLNAVKNQFTAGDTVNLTVYRSGKSYSVDVVLMDQALQG